VNASVALKTPQPYDILHFKFLNLGSLLDVLSLELLILGLEFLYFHLFFICHPNEFFKHLCIFAFEVGDSFLCSLISSS
jgi:hypothetical protein